MSCRVSIVMSVFNNAKTLRAAIESILTQTLTDWELIVINDGSTDRTAEILEEYAALDSRIKVYENSTNQGLASSLNRGWKAAKSDMIARMDADDLSHPQRLARQVAFLDTHREIDVVGTSALIRTGSGDILGCSRRPTEPAILEERILWENPFFHPSVLMRKQFLRLANGYDEKFIRSQDYEMWSRCVSWARYANIDMPLITYTKPGKLSWSSIWFGAYARWRAGASSSALIGRLWYPARFALAAFFPFLGRIKALVKIRTAKRIPYN